MFDGKWARIRSVEVLFDPFWWQIGRKVVERIAFSRTCSLAHDCCGDNQAKRVEANFRPVTIGVSHQPRLKEAVVVFSRNFVLHGVLSADKEQVICVVVNKSAMAERILEAAREEEMSPRLRRFPRSRVVRVARIEAATARNPPVIVLIQIYITAPVGISAT